MFLKVNYNNPPNLPLIISSSLCYCVLRKVGVILDLDYGSRQKWRGPRRRERSRVAFHTISGVVRIQRWISNFELIRILYLQQKPYIAYDKLIYFGIICYHSILLQQFAF